jgi:hypothetical protein
VREEKEKKLRIQLKPIVAKSDDFRNYFLRCNFGTPLLAPHFNHEAFFCKENHL